MTLNPEILIFKRSETEINVQLKFDNTLYQVENLTEEQYLENRKKIF
jgi:hypothetical protein